MGDIIQGANAEAQRSLGNFASEPVSVGDLFAGAFLPGLALVVLYALWTVLVAAFRPKAAPAMTMTAEQKANLGRDIVFSLIPALLLIVAVLGSILAGIATPTERSEEHTSELTSIMGIP